MQSLSNGLDSTSRTVKVNVERLRTSKDEEEDEADEEEDEELDVEDDSDDEEEVSEEGDDEDADEDEEDGSDEGQFVRRHSIRPKKYQNMSLIIAL